MRVAWSGEGYYGVSADGYAVRLESTEGVDAFFEASHAGLRLLGGYSSPDEFDEVLVVEVATGEVN